MDKISLFGDNALRGDHLLQLINDVTVPFVHTITRWIDNALEGDQFNSIMYRYNYNEFGGCDNSI